MKKWGIYLFITILLIIAGLGVYFYLNQQKALKIASFDECVSAGFPVLESYPPQCKTSDGRSFTQNIGNELDYINEIIVASPRPNSKISSPIKVTGKARGPWYFEASFSGELFDQNNKSLGTVILQANGEWMTEEFVEFSGDLSFEMPSTPIGELRIKNANPSGMPENEKTLIIPVRF